MHQYLPEAHDEHLFTLEIIIRAKIKELDLCIKTLMGNRDFNVDIDMEIMNQDNDNNHQDNPPRQNSFQYISRVPVKALRCLKP